MSDDFTLIDELLLPALETELRDDGHDVAVASERIALLKDLATATAQREYDIGRLASWIVDAIRD